jgi:hypothetical protein
MASGKRPSSNGPRRRRPPTVIDLQATEVESAPAAAEPPAPEIQPRAVKAEPPPTPETPFIPPSPEQPYAAAASARGPSGPPPRDPPREPPRDPPPSGRGSISWLPEDLSWSQASGAMAGAAGGFLLFLLLWLFGAFPGGGREPTAQPVDWSPRFAAIERQLQELAARPPPVGVDPKTVDEITVRLARVEAAQSAPRPPVADPVVLGRLSGAEQASRSLADNVSALARRSESVEGALRDTQNRLDKMAAALEELRATARAAAAGSDRAARLAAAAAALRGAVERGDPFAAEFAVVKPLTSDGAALAALEPFVAAGVPRNATLAHELAALVKPMLQVTGDTPRDGTFLERLQANAEKLVRVRPIGEAVGDDRAAVLARVEARALQANIPGALAELARLPADAGAPFRPWIARAEARDRAVEASRRLAADSVAALRATP